MKTEGLPKEQLFDINKMKTGHVEMHFFFKRTINLMASGWTQDGGVQEQIDASLNDAIKLARNRLPDGESLTQCEQCEEEIPEPRRKALPGVRLCVDCQSKIETQQSLSTNFNRRGNKDSQLK